MTSLEDAHVDASAVPAAPELVGELETVIDYLATAAHRGAEQIASETSARVDDTLAQAQRQADAILAAARESGADLARQGASAALADARREARHTVLAVQRLVYEQARAQARERLCAIANSPEAVALNARLGDIARERLGSNAVVTTVAGEIGVVARDGDRRVDLGTDALLERAVAALGEEIGALWS